MLTVLWHDEESAGFTDHFPDAWFAQDGVIAAGEHRVIGPRSGAYRAQCNVVVNGAVAELDYVAFGAFNTRQGMHLGVMRIQFTGADRRTVSQVYWREEGREFQPYPTTVGFRYPVTDTTDAILPEEVPTGTTFPEGSVQQILVNAHERSPAARAACITRYGPTCVVCGFNFAAVYGQLAAGFIHVHHLRPLSEVDGDYEVNPIEDLRPVCPNCHAVIHLGGGCRGIEEVQQFLAPQRQSQPEAAPDPAA